MIETKRTRWIVLPVMGALLAFGNGGLPIYGDDTATETPEAAVPNGTEVVALETEQDVIVQRFRQFEKNLLVMARYLRKVQPEQAELIERAIKQSKGNRVAQQMEAIITLLEPGNEQFGEAIERQDEIVTELKSLLLLLQSGDRRDEIEKEKARIKDLIKDLNNVIRNQQDTRSDTERGGNVDRIAEKQQNVANQTQKLVDKIDQQDAERSGEQNEGEPSDGKPSDGKPSDGKPSDGKPSDGKPSDGKPSDGKPSDGKPMDGDPMDGKPMEGDPMDGKPSDGKPMDGKPMDGKPSDGKPMDGKPSDGMPSDGMPSDGMPSDGMPSDGMPSDGMPSDGMPSDGMPSDSGGEPGDSPPPGDQPPNDDDKKKTPGRDDIAQAKKDMERAIEELKKRQRDAASKHQDDALAKLQEAKEKLEEILRQLREEERKLLLAALEARFQRMLEMQRAVWRGTVSLGRVPEDEFGQREIGKSNQLSADERDIVTEADKALNLLKEEGSSVAFPEAVEQLREDIIIISQRLSPDFPETDPRPQVGDVTQAIERDVIEALEELIEALQKEMEKGKKSPPPPPGPSGEPPDPGLVDKLAELKMLRSLQNRINRRTKLLGREIDGEQATKTDLVDQLRQLGRRQASIQKAAYDLATGRNQ